MQVVAEPDGRLIFESAIEPQRTKRTDGAWVDVDLTLSVGSDNLIRPAASVADVAFSNGGSSLFVTLRRAGKTLGLKWSGQLPTPVLSGDSATYPEVLPDVDLVIRATRTGFTHVLVVKSAKAAAHPRVRAISLPVSGEARLVRQPDGSLRAVDGSALVARADRAVMWDSSRSESGSTAEAAGSPSTVLAAGDGARTADVATRVGAGGSSLRLIPDAKLLRSPETTYPVYIDPAWSVVPAKWAYATHNNCTNTDHSVARVGRGLEPPCASSLFRSYFEFPTGNGSVSLAGKHIESAHVQMRLYDSRSCTDTPVNAYQSNEIDETMQASWSAMTLQTWLAVASGHANKGTSCVDSPQPDVTMNFTGAITAQLQQAAGKSSTSFTVGFSARDADGTDEWHLDRWTKFLPGHAKLVVDYDSRPGQPTGLRISGVGCVDDEVTAVGTLAPTFSAVYPDEDSGQALTGSYEWIEVPSGGIGTVTDTHPTRQAPPPDASATAGGRAITDAVSVAEGEQYAFRVRTTDSEPYAQRSDWSAWCLFTADVTPPPVTVTLETPPAGAGEPATFRLESTAADVLFFRYGWSAPIEQVEATGIAPRSATVILPAPKYGMNILHVSAVDATGNEGSGSIEVTVPRPAPPIARWTLQTYPGLTREQAVADGQPALGGDTPLTASEVAWTSDLRLLGGESVSFNGTNAEAVATTPVVDTTASFSVAAWVRLPALPGTDVTVVGQDGTDAAGFQLGITQQNAQPHWSFGMKDTAAESSATRLAVAPAPISAATVGQWHHIAGVYDAQSGKLRLYINGTLAGEVNRTVVPWTANGVFTVGRGFAAGNPAHWLNGSVTDLLVYNRPLITTDFTGTYGSSGGIEEPGLLRPWLVGLWSFEFAIPCFLQDLRNTCKAGDGSAFGRDLALQRGAAVSDGHQGMGLHLDGYYFPDEFPEPWEPTVEWARSAYASGTTPPDWEGNEYTIWQDTPVLRTDNSYTVSVWARIEDTDRDQTLVSQSGTHQSAFRIRYDHSSGKWTFDVAEQDAATTTRVTVSSTDPAQAGTWVHLVGVYDGSAQQIRFYVNGAPAGSAALAWTPASASGPLQIGRALLNGAYSHYWYGGVDELHTYQGALSDREVEALYDEQRVN